MHYFKSSLKVISQLLAIFVFISFPLTESYAKAGCCSHHGGVTGCSSSSGHQLCKDGTTSPSCPCNGSNYKQKQVKTYKTTPTPAPVPTTASTTNKIKAPKGCCSRHGGVAQCNKAAGLFMCKDGTQSTTCKCS